MPRADPPAQQNGYGDRSHPFRTGSAWRDKLKPILKLIDPEPLVSPVMMDLAAWAADYYSVALDQMIRCLLPETVRQENTAEKIRKMVHLENRPPGKNWTHCTARLPARLKCWIIFRR